MATSLNVLLDVGQKLVLPERVPAAVVGIDRSGPERPEHLADAVLDGARGAKVEQLAHAVEADVVVAQIGIGRRHHDLGAGHQIAHAVGQVLDADVVVGASPR